MQVAVASRNSMLVRSISLMLSDPALDMNVVSIFADYATTPGATRSDILLIDGNLPAHSRAAALEAASGLPLLVLLEDGRVPSIPGLEEADLLLMPLTQRDLVTGMTTALSRHRNRSERRIAVGALRVDLGTRSATVEGVPLPLTSREYDVLEYLALRKGVTLTKEMFLDRLYGGHDEPEIKIVDVFVCKIRRKIREITGGDTLIDTVWGRGYVLNDPDDRDLPAGAAPKRTSAAG